MSGIVHLLWPLLLLALAQAQPGVHRSWRDASVSNAWEVEQGPWRKDDVADDSHDRVAPYAADSASTVDFFSDHLRDYPQQAGLGSGFTSDVSESDLSHDVRASREQREEARRVAHRRRVDELRTRVKTVGVDKLLKRQARKFSELLDMKRLRVVDMVALCKLVMTDSDVEVARATIDKLYVASALRRSDGTRTLTRLDFEANALRLCGHKNVQQAIALVKDSDANYSIEDLLVDLEVNPVTVQTLWPSTIRTAQSCRVPADCDPNYYWRYLCQSGSCVSVRSISCGPAKPCPAGSCDIDFHCDPDPECFAPSSLIQLDDGSYKTCTDVQEGDRVRVVDIHGRVTYDDVYIRKHRPQDSDMQTWTEYLKVHGQMTSANASGVGRSQTLRVSRNHLLPVSRTNGSWLWHDAEMLPAEELQIGDIIWTAGDDISPAVVTSIEHIFERGQCAFYTMKGTVVVDGVVASVFSDVKVNGVSAWELVLGRQPNIKHDGAQVFTTMLRWMYKVVGPEWMRQINDWLLSEFWFRGGRRSTLQAVANGGAGVQCFKLLYKIFKATRV